MKELMKEEKAQVSPLAGTNVEELVDYLASMSGGSSIEPGLGKIQDDRGQGTVQGWQLASGVELLRCKAALLQPLALQRTAEPDYPVWSIMLTDSANLVASHGEQPVQQPSEVPVNRGGMIYLYNHHLSLDLVFEGQVNWLLIRLKPDAWQHLLQDPPRHVTEFVEDSRSRFHGFDLQTSYAEYYQQLLRDDHKEDSPWQRLQATLGICSQVFAQLGQRELGEAGASLRPRDSQRIHRARQLLLRDFQSPLSLAEIGTQVGLGRDKLRQLFQQVYGTTPNRYYQQQRMHEARRLIREEGVSAMDAGFQVGYSHLGHFAQAFKKQFGCLPKDCKKTGG